MYRRTVSRVDTKPRSRRDPEGRRRAIVQAAAELIAGHGTKGITHRMVAAHAGVPLGSTTQYFASLDDLRAAALEMLFAEIDADLDRVRAAMADPVTAPRELAKAWHEFLHDPRMVRAENALFVAALHDPEMRAVSRRWFTEMVAILTPHIGAARATAIAVLGDGSTWHAALHDEPLDLETLTVAITTLFGKDEA